MNEWIIEDSVLCHHGVKGQKWGVRRYQNVDGSLTIKGRAKLELYKEKQQNRLDKGINFQKNMNQKVFDRYAKKASKLMDRDETVSEKLRGKMIDRQHSIELANRVRDAQSKKIRKMDFESMQKERKDVRGRVAEEVFRTMLVGGAAGGAIGGAVSASAKIHKLSSSGKEALMRVYSPDGIDMVKAMSRISADELRRMDRESVDAAKKYVTRMLSRP